VRQGPEASLKARPNLICGTEFYQGFKEIFDGLDEVALAENYVGVFRDADGDRVKVEVS
jgi:hypothetical protein